MRGGGQIGKNHPTEVDQMHDGMNPGLKEYDDSDQLMKVDIMIQGDDRRETHVP